MEKVITNTSFMPATHNTITVRRRDDMQWYVELNDVMIFCDEELEQVRVVETRLKRALDFL